MIHGPPFSGSSVASVIEVWGANLPTSHVSHGYPCKRKYHRISTYQLNQPWTRMNQFMRLGQVWAVKAHLGFWDENIFASMPPCRKQQQVDLTWTSTFPPQMRHGGRGQILVVPQQHRASLWVGSLHLRKKHDSCSETVKHGKAQQKRGQSATALGSWRDRGVGPH